MSVFIKRVERWRALVKSIVRNDWTNIVLSIIQNESGGIAGRPGSIKTKSATLPLRGGATIKADVALGLMQVIPPNIADWNTKHRKVTYDSMTGKTDRDAAIQIRLGWWILDMGSKRLKRDFPNIPELIDNRLNPDFVKFSLVAYAWGIGRTVSKMKKVQNEGIVLNWANFAKRYPELGKPKNQPLVYVSRVAPRALPAPQFDPSVPNDPVVIDDPIEMVAGFDVKPMLVILAVVVVASLLSR